MKDAEIKENIFIPKKLKCGFNLRHVKDDSYVKKYVCIDGQYVKVEETTEPTYKVGFVSYYDEKGRFRQETSFNNWISEKVPTEKHENVPTKGFKIFKQANRFSYNRFASYRNVSFEIQDPRGWVFEITQNNLAWIIDNCSINKGDIEGEFVYGWDGKDRLLFLVLLRLSRTTLHFLTFLILKVTLLLKTCRCGMFIRVSKEKR